MSTEKLLRELEMARLNKVYVVYNWNGCDNEPDELEGIFTDKKKAMTFRDTDRNFRLRTMDAFDAKQYF